MSEPNDTDILMNGEEWFAKNRGILINVTLVILIGVVGWNWIENKSSASSIEAESALVNALSSDSTNLVEVARLLPDRQPPFPRVQVPEGPGNYRYVWLRWCSAWHSREDWLNLPDEGSPVAVAR